MSEHVPCRWCRSLGFLISGLLHLALVAAFLWSEPGTPDVGDGHVVRVTLATFRSGEVEDIPGEKRDAPASAGETDPEPETGPAREPRSGAQPESPTESQAISSPESVSEPQAREQPANPKPKSEPKPASKSKRKPAPKSKTAVAAVNPSPRLRERTGTSGHPAAGSPQTAAFGAPPEGGSDHRSGATGARPAPPAAEGNYLAELRRAIAANRFYPSQARRRGLDGVVTVYFVIRGDGRIADIRISEGSGSGLLDSAAIETMKRLGRFKPIPKEFGREHWPLRVPIAFALR